MAVRGSYHGGSTIIKVRRTFKIDSNKEKDWQRVLKLTALKGKVIREKKRKLLKKKIYMVEKSINKLKASLSILTEQEDLLEKNYELRLKIIELSQLLNEKESMGSI